MSKKVGRPLSNHFEDLEFILIKGGERSYQALCLVCDAVLKNTAKCRLQMHRNICIRRSASKRMRSQSSSSSEAHLEGTETDNNASISSTNNSISTMSCSEQENWETMIKEEVTLSPFNNRQNTGLPERKNTNTNRKKNRKSNSGSFEDQLSNEEKVLIDEDIAAFIFACNLPLKVIESSYFKNLIKRLRPSYVQAMPSRRILSTELLDDVYNKCLEYNKNLIKSYSVLLVYEWKNSSCNKKTVVTMIHCADGTQTLLNVWDISEESETGEKLSEIVFESCQMAREMYETEVYAVVSDKASVNLKMENLPRHEIWHLACSNHTGNLLAKNVKKSINDNVVMVLKEFKQADLEQMIVDEGGNRLILPCETSLCTFRDSYTCLVKNLTQMKVVAADNVKNIKPAVTALLFDNEFITEVEENILLFDSICRLIDVCQCSTTSVADAINLWLDLEVPEKYKTNLENCLEMVCNDYALTAFYLHPGYNNTKLKKDYMSKINRFLLNYLNAEGLEDLDNFKENTGIFQILNDKNVTKPLVFWRTVQMEHPVLSELALKLLQIPASSSQLERVFSSWGHVHTPIRNRLNFERSRKLAHIYYHFRVMDISTFTDVQGEDDEDDAVAL